MEYLHTAVVPVWIAFPAGLILVALTAIALTRWRQISARYTEERARHQAFIATASDWLWETDAQHRFVWFSENAPTRFVTRLPVSKKRTELAVGTLETDQWQQHLADLQAHRPFQDFIYQARGSEDEIMAVRVSGVPVFDRLGRFTGYRGTACNLTTAWRSGQGMSGRDEMLRQALEHIHTPIMVLDPSLNILVWNEQMERLFDLPPGLVEVGRPIRDIVMFQARRGDLEGDASEENVDRILRTMPPLGPEVVIAPRPWGKVIEVHRRQVPDLGYVLSYVDITERLKNETRLRDAMQEAHAANRAKSTFLANMSHELRTPLNAIIGFAEIMEGQLFGPLGGERYVEYVRDIKDSGSHLLDVINDILDLSKIEAGRIELVEEEVTVERILAAAERLVRDRAARSGLNFVRSCPPTMPRIYADTRFLRQMLLNLLSNAIKFTGEGGTITLAADQRPSGEITLIVSDTGIGMDPEDLPIALAPFGQLDNAYSRKFEGTGLGLPLVKSMAEMHGGRLEIETAPGQGTRADIIIPVERVRANSEPGL
ncbi:PAS domain-containing sensor histidine kinase [Lacibacterium aquatile]|uniref:histidine kinase n=1 Tax=Lacibacterium aquatile TaxID=1168082 RepID=A0ABW5DZS9_9PROT